MTSSSHAQKRCQQRGIKNTDIDILIANGTEIQRPGNATGFILTKKRAKDLHRSIDKVCGKMVIVENGTPQTVYKLTKRIKNK
jgi:hypothetical protein